jgi:hypothetical protein
MSEIQLGFYRHYKGQLYQVIGTATHSETFEKMALYIPQYGAGGHWVRPLAMFQENVIVEGVEKPRFEYLQSHSPAEPTTQPTSDQGSRP